ncbi:MAG: adenine deaminase [Firmicutes bacterium]|nr:adenine deaminase [Bacillota bacterium]
MKRSELIDVTLGQEAADLVIKGGKLVNVHTEEIYEADVAIKGSRIAAVGDVGKSIGPETKIIDATGKYITPGLIETHQHVAGSHLSMREFARAALSHGTTSIATDFYEIGSVAGVKGIRACLDQLKATPLKVFFVIPMPAFLQNGEFGHTGALTFDDMKQMLEWPECFGLNEAFAPEVLQQIPEILELINLTRKKGKVIVGHASEIKGRELQAWLAFVGTTNDHECVSAEEALEKSRLGIRILLREGSAASDVQRVIRAITEYKADPRMFAFCTDEEDPERLVKIGHIDHKIRLAVRAGVNPITAIQMATINAAECYQISHELGSIVPGKIADVLLVDDIANFTIDSVIANGEIVVENRRFVCNIKCPDNQPFMYQTVRLPRRVSPDDFKIAAPAEDGQFTVRVIGATEGDLITSERRAVLKAVNGYLEADVAQDVLKIAVFDRHSNVVEVGKGFIQGFMLQDGAIASTFNPHKEDLVVVGTNDADMAVAVNRVVELGGGFVAVRGGAVIGEVPLPLFGLLSDKNLEEVLDEFEKLRGAVKSLGCQFRGPFTMLGFMCLPVIIGTLKICSKGLVDVWSKQIVDLVVS